MNPHLLTNINYCWAGLLIEELVRNGVDYFCISSGSRSSPLTVSVAHNPKAKSFVHFDERASAFHALGYASATGKPACIITTSGTAAANLFPAVIEAAKKKVPLIILTADRPPELRQTGAHQTIDQTKIFGSYVRHFTDMPTPTTEIPAAFVLTTIDQAVFQAKGELKAPVHINCMFRDPLIPLRDRNDLKSYIKPISPWLKSTSAFTLYKKSEPTLNQQDFQTIANQVSKIKNGLIVIGKLPLEEAKCVLQLAQRLNWPIFPDFTSGLRQMATSKHVIHYFDQLLLNPRFVSRCKFDGIIHFGGRMTSKRFYEWLKIAQPKQYIMVLNHPLRNDPLYNVTLRVQAKSKDLCDRLWTAIKTRPGFGQLKHLIQANAAAGNRIEKILSQKSQISESAVAHLITKHIPQGHALFVSNSLPIRELDMYAGITDKTCPIGSNRGASGIDGIVASACGFSQGTDKPTTLFIGDLAFLYDLNALTMLAKVNHPMTLVVLNNNGGGIFSFLPIAKEEKVFEDFYGTPHNLRLKALTDVFDLNYAQPVTNDDFVRAYQTATTSSKSTLIEVRTFRRDTLKDIQDIQFEIKNLKI